MASDTPTPPPVPLPSGWLKGWIATLAPKGGALVILSILAALGWDKVQQHPWYAGLIAYSALVLVNFAEEVGRELKAGAVKGTADLIRLVFSSALLLPRWLWGGARWLSSRATDRTTRRYLDALVNKYGLFNDRGLGLINANRLDLERVYVNLRVAGDVNLNRPGLDPFARDVRGDLSLWDFLRSTRPGVALAVIGPPGCGKTTLLHHALLTLARRRHRRHRVSRRLPILVELRTMVAEINAADPPSLGQVAEAAARKLLPSMPAAVSAAWFEARLAAGGCAVMLDGLDEVGSEESRKAVARWLDVQVGRDGYRDNLFVLTSRPQGYRTAPLDRATVLEVQPFGPTQVREFIDNWYLANEIVSSGNRDDRVVRRRAADGAGDLHRRLGENPTLNDLTGNPLLLTMMTMVHRYHGALPGSRVQLYAEVCQVLLERWRQGKGIEDRLRGDQKLAVLQPLAAHMMELRTRELSEADVLVVIGPQAERIGVPITKRAQFLRDLQSVSGLLLEKEAGFWAFAHHSFQEYLTAAHWGKHPPTEAFWPSAVGESWWRETLLLYASQNDASSIVAASLASSTPASLAFTFSCVAECHSLDPDVRDCVNTSLVEVLMCRDPVLFAPAAEAWLIRCQQDYVRLSDTTEIATRLVSQAEFQCFLNQVCPNSFGYRPPHWNRLWFEGDPQSPVAGLTGESAMAFCMWLDTRDALFRHRLPRRIESESHPLGGKDAISSWTREEDSVLRCSLPPGLGDAIARSQATLIAPPGGWETLLTSSMSELRAITLDLDFPFPLPVGVRDHLLARELARARAIDIANDRASDLANDRDPDRELDRQLSLARDRALALALALTNSRAGDRAGDSASSLARDLARDLARVSTLASDLARASTLARTLARDLGSAVDLAWDRDRAFQLALLLVFAVARNLARAGYNRVLIRALRDGLSVLVVLRFWGLPLDAAAGVPPGSRPPGLVETAFDTFLCEWEPRPNSRPVTGRLRLLRTLVEAADASDQLTASRHLRRFLHEWILTDLLPHLEQNWPGRASWFRVRRQGRRNTAIEMIRGHLAYVQLALARESKTLPAWEGLRIVRERK